ncbi:MAG TPA: CAP domain-containing protein [Patescibacteria group bacterium]|nr:CAP domain-containing protein [Patescibacteria group bacterium]
MELFRHLFLPHYSNNQRAKILHYDSVLVIAVALFIGSFFVGTVKKNYQDVLGISYNISAQDLLNLTNQDRIQAGDSPLTIDSQLTQAAAGKAEDMFFHNYWAHVSPTGVTPWQFITDAGYHYTTAGENLARGYTTASDVITAWMNSPEHRANMLSKNYTNVGFAVQQGTLTGDNNTVLVVEMFGSRTYAQSPQTIPPIVQQVQAQNYIFPNPTVTPMPTIPPSLAPQASSQAVVRAPLMNSVLLVRLIGMALVLMFIITLTIDVILIDRKQIIRIVGHNIDHMLFLIAILLIATLLGSGVLL